MSNTTDRNCPICHKPNLATATDREKLDQDYCACQAVVVSQLLPKPSVLNASDFAAAGENLKSPKLQ